MQPCPVAGDPRNILRSRNGAIFATQSQTDYRDARQAYRADSDADDDHYRYREAAGPAHVVVEQTTSEANAADTPAAGGTTRVEDYAICLAGAQLQHLSRPLPARRRLRPALRLGAQRGLCFCTRRCSRPSAPRPSW